MFYWLKKQEAEKLAAQIEQGVSDSSEMISTVKRVRNAFRKDTKFDKDMQDRIFKRIMAASGAPESNISTVAQNRPIKLGKVLVATGLVVALAILILGSSKTYLPLKGFNTEKALAAIEQPGMITYYKVVGSYKGDDPARIPNLQAEYWVDYEKQMLKSITRQPIGGANITTHSLIRDGKVIHVTRENDEVKEVQESDAPESFDDLITSGVRTYRELLKSGKAEVLSEEEIKGIATYKIMRKATAKDGTTHIEIVEIANIRKDNYKPVKVIHEVWKTRQGKKRELDGVWTTSFGGIRLIDPKDLDEDVFAIDVPKGRTGNLSIEQARQFKEFDLYYLGKSFDGYEFSGQIQVQYGINREAYMTYGDSKKPGGVSIQIWPADPRGENTPRHPDYKRITVTIDGNPVEGDMFTGKDRYSPSSCSLLINIGRSTVFIASSGKDEAEAKDRVIRAAESLVKIN